MNDKYSPTKCAQYGRRLAARLCDQHFGPQPTATLDGPAVLKFTSVRQLNLLVIRQLLGQWQAETAQLRSAYFDFEAAPIQAALTQFMNVLSRHIRLGRAAYEPLLAQAAADTLSIVADPAGSFERLLLGTTETPTLAGLRDNLRYLDIDKAFFQGFIDNLPVGTDLSREFLIHRFELHRAANYKAHQPLQRLVEELSTLLPLTTADLLEDGPVSAISPVAPGEPTLPAIAPEPKPLAPPTFVVPPMLPPAPEPVAAPAISATTVPAPASATSPASSPVFLPPNQETTSVPLHEKLKAGQPSAPVLADTLRATTAPASLAERAATKVETLREAISINQRFSFINELFGGENMDYHAAIQHLDSLTTAEQARAHVTGALSQRYDWSRKEEHVSKLLKLIERKFA